MTDSGQNVGGLPNAGAIELNGGKWRGWAVYLGVSWTWCIGMFLPALLWRDYGPWSFVVFALPNVIGAAAMGLVMRTPEASRTLLDRHRWACFSFSAVTVAFQVFFAAWVARVMGGGVWHAGWVLCVAGALFSGPWMRRAAVVVGAAVWVASVLTVAATVMREAEGGLLYEIVDWKGALPAHHLVPLALVCVLGFGLCPYLDRTFHRARIESGRKSVEAFGVGFGFFFTMMIVGTLLTAPVLVWLVGASGPQSIGRMLIALFAAHTLPQLVYTCWVHGGEAQGRGERAGLAVIGALTGLTVVLLGAGPLVQQFGWDAGWANPLYGGEVGYRCFMAFYGLVFPAYVAIVAWPVKWGGAIIRPARLLVFLVAVGVAAAFYWMGFVERHTWWVAAGVGVVVAGKLVSRVFVGEPRARQGAGSL